MAEKTQAAAARDRLLTLLFLAAASAAYYGPRVLLLCGTAAAISLLTDRICLYLRKKPFQMQDIESVASGILLAMMFPPTVPYPLLIIACIFAIIIGRQIFGGSENPLFPTAAVGYVFARTVWKNAVIQYPAAKQFLPLLSKCSCAMSTGAATVWNQNGKITGHLSDWLTCIPAVPMGSASLVMLGTAAIVLWLRRSAAFHASFSMVLMMTLMSMLTSSLNAAAGMAMSASMMNLTLFSAVYLVGDTDLAPRGFCGVLYGALAGIFCFYLTRIAHIENAPVLLSILMQPLGIWCSRCQTIIQQWLTRKEAADNADTDASTLS